MKETIFSLIVFSIIFSCGKNEKQDLLRDIQKATTVLSEKTSEFLAEKIALDFANSYVQFIKKDADLSETKKWVEQNKEVTEAFKKIVYRHDCRSRKKKSGIGIRF